MPEYQNITGFPGYHVGSDGSVWTCLNNRWGPDGYWRPMKPQISKRKHARFFVHLWKDGRKHARKIHTLVLTAFVGPRPKDQEGCHKNGDFRNNTLENLRWGTKKENAADKVKHGTDNRGEKHPLAELTSQKVIEIRRLHSTGQYTLKQIGELFEKTGQMIGKIVSRKNWKYI